MKTTITKTIEATQYEPGSAGFEGTFKTQLEVCWSSGRELVYFTFGHLRSRSWMGVEKLTEQPTLKGGLFDPGYGRFEAKDGSVYWRQVLDFAFWSVKSEASAKQDHSTIFADRSDPVMKELTDDYVAMSGWVTKPEDIDVLNATIEFRETDGSLARGYRPHYMMPGDWLLCEVIDGKKVYTVKTDSEFTQMKAAA